MTELFIAAGVTYLLLLLLGNLAARANAWNSTIADRLWWYPAETAFMALGWLVMHASLVAAALLALSPLLFFLGLLWLASA